MGRIAAPENLRLRQTRQFDVTYAGAEASVAASICNFGGNARYITALPKHTIPSIGLLLSLILRLLYFNPNHSLIFNLNFRHPTLRYIQAAHSPETLQNQQSPRSAAHLPLHHYSALPVPAANWAERDLRRSR